MENCGKLWEIAGKPMENCCKPMENCGKLWETAGKPMENCGKPMENCGKPVGNCW